VRILFIVDSIPYPILGGSALRINNLIRGIAADHQVWLAAFVKNEEQVAGAARMREFCAGVEFVQTHPRSALSDPSKFLAYILKGIPPELRFFASAALARKIRDLMARVRFDVIHIEQVHMGLYLNHVPRNDRRRTVWGLQDIDYPKFKRIIPLEPKTGRRLRLRLNNNLMRRWEPRHAAKFGRCIAVSEPDRRLLMDGNPRLKVEVIPNGVDARLYTPMAEPEGKRALVFVGNMAYRPCVDAVLYFTGQILPLVKQAVPDVELWIVGQSPSEQVMKLNGDGIRVTGRVEDVRPYYGRCLASVVPLRAGGGTRLKILEALALGRPVVSTSLGCEGLELVDNEHILIADDPVSFARKTVRLLTDRTLRERLAGQGRRAVAARYDWSLIAKRLIRVYQEMAAP
jgi:polysaccharide biosynthesis protein PslH